MVIKLENKKSLVGVYKRLLDMEIDSEKISKKEGKSLRMNANLKVNGMFQTKGINYHETLNNKPESVRRLFAQPSNVSSNLKINMTSQDHAVYRDICTNPQKYIKK